jgi:drug/metabolite transporter (DMT)-like permease
VAYATLILFVLANKLTTAANTIFLQSTAPLYILLNRCSSRSTSTAGSWFMAAIAVMAMFFIGRQDTMTAPDPVRGNLLALFSGVTYAEMLMGLRYMGTRGSPATAAVSAISSRFAATPAMSRWAVTTGDWLRSSTWGLPDRSGSTARSPGDSPLRPRHRCSS